MLIYFRWCQSFHYRPHFSEVYNLVIKTLQGLRLGRCRHSCPGPPRSPARTSGTEQRLGYEGHTSRREGVSKRAPPASRVYRARLMTDLRVSEVGCLGGWAAVGEALLPTSESLGRDLCHF